VAELARLALLLSEAVRAHPNRTHTPHPQQALVVPVVSADSEPGPVLADDLLIRDPRANCDVSQDLLAPTSRSDTDRDLGDRADRHNASAVTPLLQLPHLPVEVLATIRPGIEDRSTRHAVSEPDTSAERPP
jgi:hypothetical protein